MWENTQNTYKIGIPSPTHTLLNFWLLFLLDQLLKSQYFHLVVWRNMRPLVLNFWLWLDFLFVLACIKVISYFLYTTVLGYYVCLLAVYLYCIGLYVMKSSSTSLSRRTIIRAPIELPSANDGMRFRLSLWPIAIVVSTSPSYSYINQAWYRMT